MGVSPKPDAQNRQEKRGAYTASTVRWSPKTIVKLDALVRVWTSRHGRNYTRTSFLNDVIDAMHAAEFGPEPLRIPNAPTTGPAHAEPGVQPRPNQPKRRRK